MQFREITTRDEFLNALPIMDQDAGDVVDSNIRGANFEIAVKNNYRCFAAYDGMNIIAVVGMVKVFSPNYVTPVYEINHVVVDEQLRRKGIGSKVLEFCRQTALADGVNALRLGVYPTDKSTIDFYQKNGFKHTANFMFQSLEGSAA